ncbi:ATP-binding cassette domain-containing protein [Cytobacillus sp. Hm23]
MSNRFFVYHIVSEIWKFKKIHLIISIFLIAIFAIQANANILLSKYIINSIGDKKLKMTILLIVLTLVFELVVFVLKSLKQLYDKKTQEEYNIYTSRNLIETISQFPVLEKENPEFMRKYQLWRQYSPKYLETTGYYIVIVQMILTSFMSIVYLMQSLWYLGLLALLISCVKGWLDFKMIPKRIKANNSASNLSHKEQYIFSMLSNSAFQKELTILKLFKYLNKKSLDIKKNVLKLRQNIEIEDFKVNIFGKILLTASSMTILIVISSMVITNKLTMGDYISIPLAFTIVVSSVENIFLTTNRVLENHKCIKQYKNEVNEYKKFQPKGTTEFNFTSLITIRDLTFRYVNGVNPALNKINMTIRKGEKIVILGDNGSGKSTLVKLILGLYQAPMRSISYDGIYQEELDLETLWSKSSVVFQDFIRYMLTLRENVAFGNIDNIASEDKIIETLNLVGFETRKFKNGLSSELGFMDDDSVNLSGGQWQRIALARALFGESELLVFDEPTSALDPLSELEFFDYLLSKIQDKTLLIISHRISIASKADKIIMMKDGEIKEFGTHEDLIKSKGHYYKMWKKQREWYTKREREMA